MHSGSKFRSMHIRSQDGRETIELRVATIEPARGKGSDADVWAASASAFARAKVRSGDALASCSSSSRTMASTRPNDGASIAEASTPNLSFRLNRHD